MSDAQKGWPDVVNQANARFEKATGAKVKVEWQQWSNYTTKLDSTFAGHDGRSPTSVELGNTQTASYIVGGRLHGPHHGQEGASRTPTPGSTA